MLTVEYMYMSMKLYILNVLYIHTSIYLRIIYIICYDMSTRARTISVCDMYKLSGSLDENSHITVELKS